MGRVFCEYVIRRGVHTLSHALATPLGLRGGGGRRGSYGGERCEKEVTTLGVEKKQTQVGFEKGGRDERNRDKNQTERNGREFIQKGKRMGKGVTLGLEYF